MPTSSAPQGRLNRCGRSDRPSPLARMLPGNGLLDRHGATSCASPAPKRAASLLDVAYHQAARHDGGEAALHIAADADRECGRQHPDDRHGRRTRTGPQALAGAGGARHRLMCNCPFPGIPGRGLLPDELTRYEGRQTFKMLMRPFDKTPSAKVGCAIPLVSGR